MKQRHIAALLAEFLGTFVLVMVVLNVSRYGLPFFTAIGAGVAVATFFSAVGKFSGGHYNPAITLGLFSIRQITFVRTVAYIIAQAVGGVAGWQLYQYLTQRHLTNSTTAFDWRIMLAELIGMIVLSMAMVAVVKQKLEGYQAAATIGLAYFVGLTIAGLASNALLNPALALGVRSFDLNYAIGPIVGALVGVSLYNYVMEPMVRKLKTAKVEIVKPVAAKKATRPVRKPAAKRPAKKAKK
jgi:glycerol uptake facilitator-like aquaporin